MSDLLRFTAGDLSPQAASKLESHLRGCSACATHLRSWDATLEAYRRHAPGARENLPRWDGFDEALHREEHAWHHARATRTRRQWATAAAIAVTVLGSAWFWQRAEVVLNAEEVITRAVRQEREQPSAGAAAVWILETSATAVRMAGGARDVQNIESETDRASQVVSSRGLVARELAMRLSGYGFSWATPLSAHPLQRWRALAERPQDSMYLIDPALLKVSTTTTTGTIRKAEIVVRQHTYEPVSQHWLFADGFEVELTSVKPDERPPVAAPTLPAAHETVNPAPLRVQMESVELDVRSMLQSLGAPVGSALTVRQARGRVAVEGTVDATELARKIAVFARGRRTVDVRVTVREGPGDRDVAISRDLRVWLDQTLRNDEVREAFVGRTWELLDRLRITICALEELGRRYDSDRTATLSPDAKRTLADLAARQYNEVTTGYEALERQLAPLIGTLSRPVMAPGLPADWRRVGASAKLALDGVADGLARVFAADGANEPIPMEFEQSAREVLRPTLETLATGVVGQR